MDDTEQHLLSHGIRPTAMRILVWREAARATTAFTLADMEQWLPNADKSSIFRALRLFAEQRLLHETDDGSGQRKYCVARVAETRNHVHFSCTRCGKTYCLTGLDVPLVTMPDGFNARDVEYIIKGVCPNCSG